MAVSMVVVMAASRGNLMDNLLVVRMVYWTVS